MNTERQIEILEILLSKINSYYNGICEVLIYSYIDGEITANEYHLMKKFLDENIPTPDNQYKEFTQNEYWKNPYSSYNLWWDAMTKAPTKEIRKKYLEKLVSNLK